MEARKFEKKKVDCAVEEVHGTVFIVLKRQIFG